MSWIQKLLPPKIQRNDGSGRFSDAVATEEKRDEPAIA